MPFETSAGGQPVRRNALSDGRTGQVGHVHRRAGIRGQEWQVGAGTRTFMNRIQQSVPNGADQWPEELGLALLPRRIGA